MCAGPGGKSALLAALAGERGAGVLASELQFHRAQLVRRSTRVVPAGLLGVIAADGTRPAWRAGSFDRVLLDAPCSGLGALRRRPEARWRRSASDLDELVPLQKRLLSAALDSVRGVCGARRTFRRTPRGRRAVVLRGADTVRRPAAGHRPAVAAPAHHRRDVLRRAAQDLTMRCSVLRSGAACCATGAGTSRADRRGRSWDGRMPPGRCQR